MKSRLELIKLGIPALSLVLLTADHFGWIDQLRGLDRVQAVADNFALSYGRNPSAPIYPEDPAWKPLLGVIQKYSKAQLRTDKQPATVARLQATLSTQEPIGNGQLSQWTSPSTPFVVFYRRWPAPGTEGFVIGEDFTMVGTIGDLQNWITQSKNTAHFLVQNVLTTFLTLVVGYALFHITYVRKS